MTIDDVSILIGVLLCGCVTGAALVGAAVAGYVLWVAAGEPDVNGDPERDAGIDTEIEHQSLAWDRGSAATAANKLEEPRHA